nr:MAG TPA: putative tail component [Caudoviricetes sp.]
MAVEFEDNRVEVIGTLNEAAINFLYEAAGEVQSMVKRNTAVDTGQLKNSWDYVVEEENMKATVGSPLENAIWEELGTGEYALNGDGRKGGWTYADDRGEFHHTYGKKPRRALAKAFEATKPKIVHHAENVFREGFK